MSRLRHNAASHPGAARAVNQDAWLCRPEIGLFAVADGVGAHGGGEAASRAVVEALRAIPAPLPPAERPRSVSAALQGAHDELLRLGRFRDPPAPIASTVVVLMLHERHFACLWAGDSRAYRLRGGELARLTTDHSVVQELVSGNAITEAEASTHPRRNVITRAVGAGDPKLRLDRVVGDARAGDRFVLCSDGLYTALAPADVAGMLDDPGNAAERLVRAAVMGFSRDDVTAIVAAPCDEGCARMRE